jgi:tRNA-binding EMAP/Myf-like protein
LNLFKYIFFLKKSDFESCGMVICASNSDKTKVEVLRPAAGKLELKFNLKFKFNQKIIKIYLFTFFFFKSYF